MPIYFFAAATETTDAGALESRIRQHIPELQKVDSITDLSRRLPTPGAAEQNYVLLPFSHAQTSIDRLVEIAAHGAGILFFIFISDDISANDYKRLVRAGNADWVSAQGAPQEILDIMARHRRGGAAGEAPGGAKPVIVSFLPSAGGVGNATLAIETAVQIKTGKTTRERTVCLIDLDFQTSHVCDLLDIEPRLKIEEFAQHPERLDAQLFEGFVSHHSSGLDVLAVPRSKETGAEPGMEALDALFSMMSQRYELILIDLPVAWAPWTQQILSVSELAVLTGLNTIPSLRQVAETLAAIRTLDQVPPKIVVALNRCESGLLGGASGQSYAKRMLNQETVFYVREDPATARRSVNTGVPITLASPSSRITKDIAKLTAELSGLKAAQPVAPAG